MLHPGPHGQLGTVKGSFCDDIACNCIGASMSMCCAVMGLIKTRSIDHRRMALSIQKDSWFHSDKGIKDLDLMDSMAL